MTLPEARRIFGELMKKARERELSPSEKELLSRARQTLRGEAKSVMRNPEYKYHCISGSGFASTALCQRGRMSQRQLMGVPWERRSEVTCTKCLKRIKQIEAIKAKRSQSNPTRKKARTILHEDKVRGRRLTAKQRRFFGARASGYPRRKAKTNPSSLVRMGKLVELRYHRDHGKSPGFYKHVFKARPTLYYDRERNRIIAG